MRTLRSSQPCLACHGTGKRANVPADAERVALAFTCLECLGTGSTVLLNALTRPERPEA